MLCVFRKVTDLGVNMRKKVRIALVITVILIVVAYWFLHLTGNDKIYTRTSPDNQFTIYAKKYVYSSLVPIPAMPGRSGDASGRIFLYDNKRAIELGCVHTPMLIWALDAEWGIDKVTFQRGPDAIEIKLPRKVDLNYKAELPRETDAKPCSFNHWGEDGPPIRSGTLKTSTCEYEYSTRTQLGDACMKVTCENMTVLEDSFSPGSFMPPFTFSSAGQDFILIERSYGQLHDFEAYHITERCKLSKVELTMAYSLYKDSLDQGQYISKGEQLKNVDGDLIYSFSIWNKHDANCCPTGGSISGVYEITKGNGRFKLTPKNMYE